MSTRACPDWPTLMELAPDLTFRHYTLREAHIPTDAFVLLEGVDLDAITLCCDIDAHVYNAEHTDPAVAAALHGTYWTDLREGAHRS